MKNCMFTSVTRVHLNMICNVVMCCCLASCSNTSDQAVHQPDESIERASDPYAERNLVVIAAIGGVDDDTQKIITQELENNSIEVGFEGSIVYDVFVPKKYAKKASEILRGLDALKDKWIKHIDLETGSFRVRDDE